MEQEAWVPVLVSRGSNRYSRSERMEGGSVISAIGSEIDGADSDGGDGGSQQRSRCAQDSERSVLSV